MSTTPEIQEKLSAEGIDRTEVRDHPKAKRPKRGGTTSGMTSGMTPAIAPEVAVVLAVYNNQNIVQITLEAIADQDYPNLSVYIADDGSTDATVRMIRETAETHNRGNIIHLIPLNHNERGVARAVAIQKAFARSLGYLLFIDSDMILKPGMISSCVKYMTQNPEVGGLIIPEIPYSIHRNYISRVKVFEREIMNNSGLQPDKSSIEAARFWVSDAYTQSGGLKADQIAFEEIQPTLRYQDAGGIVHRAIFTGMRHNEGRVELRQLLRKKSYYFSKMPKATMNENQGLRKAIRRFYFFRRVLYRPSNVLLYFAHPLLSTGMFFMYFCLSFLSLKVIFKSAFGRKALERKNKG